MQGREVCTEKLIGSAVFNGICLRSENMATLSSIESLLCRERELLVQLGPAQVNQ